MYFFNLDKGFLAHTRIKVLLGLVLLISLVPIPLIAINESLRFCATSACFNNILVYFDWSLKSFAFGVGILTIFLTIYRSEQAQKSIELSKEHNNINNYFKHMEEFDKHLNSISHKYLGSSDYKEQHHLFFHKVQKGDFSYNKDQLGFIVKRLGFMYQSFKEISQHNAKEANILAIKRVIYCFNTLAIVCRLTANRSMEQVVVRNDFPNIKSLNGSGQWILFFDALLEELMIVRKFCSFVNYTHDYRVTGLLTEIYNVANVLQGNIERKSEIILRLEYSYIRDEAENLNFDSDLNKINYDNKGCLILND